MNDTETLSQPVAKPPAPSAAMPEIDLDSPALYLNRELTWLAFNRRVLTRRMTRATPAGAGQVPGHREQQPRRVLHEAHRRPQAADRRRCAHALAGRAHAHRADPRLSGGHPRDPGRPEAHLRRAHGPAGDQGYPAGQGQGSPSRCPGETAGLLFHQHLPDDHTAGHGPGSPLPLHLQPRAQPPGDPALPRRRRDLHGQGQGPGEQGRLQAPDPGEGSQTSDVCDWTGNTPS